MYSAFIVTFHRCKHLSAVLDSLLEQTVLPRRIVVVDNGCSHAVEQLSRVYRQEIELDYLRSPENLGPAGGSQLALNHLWNCGPKHQWIARLDDDRPAPTKHLFEHLIGEVEDFRKGDPNIAGIGLHGAIWNPRAASLSRPRNKEPGDSGPRYVDYLATGSYPLFHSECLRQVNGFRPDLFFGHTEVELGLRMREKGYKFILADKWSDEWYEEYKTKGGRDYNTRYTLATYDWRRYYSLRNVLLILIERKRWWTTLGVAVVRGILKPLAWAPIMPRRAATHIVWNSRAIRDGFLGRRGKTVDPLEWQKFASQELPPT